MLNTAGHLDPAPPSKFCPSPWDTGHWVTALNFGYDFVLLVHFLEHPAIMEIGLCYCCLSGDHDHQHCQMIIQLDCEFMMIIKVDYMIIKSCDKIVK